MEGDSTETERGDFVLDQWVDTEVLGRDKEVGEELERLGRVDWTWWVSGFRRFGCDVGFLSEIVHVRADGQVAS